MEDSGIEWMPGQPRPMRADSRKLAADLALQMDQALDQLRRQRVRSADGGITRHTGLAGIVDDGETLSADGCTAAQLSAIEPEDLDEVTDATVCEARIGEEGAKVLAGWAAGGYLRELDVLDLSCTPLGAGMGCLADGLLKGCPKLETLRLDGAFHQEETSMESLATLINDHPRLRELSMFSCFIDDIAALVIAQGLINSRSLQHLALDWNGIGPDGADALAEAMRGNTVLRRLDLGHNRLVDAGAGKLLGMLNRCPRVQHLGLEYNGIHGLDGVPPDALESPGLKTLVLSNNHLNVPGAVQLGKLLQCSKGLTALYLEGNSLGNDGLCVLLHSIVEAQSSVRCLDVSRNGVTRAGIVDAAVGLTDEKCRLVRLDLSGNAIGDDGWAVLAEALPEAVSLRWLTVRKCGIRSVGSHRVDTTRGGRCRVDVRDDGDADSDSDDVDDPEF